LFAPSWLYRSHPETGADFAHQRLLLDRLGLANRLIVTGESASIEDNAAAIAAALRAARPEDGSLILVTASKSGAEAALALSRLLAPEDTARVVAWVNIVGALGGTPLADSALRPPISWRSEEHTSELQSRFDLVCRLLLEKKKKTMAHYYCSHHQPTRVTRLQP